MELPRYLAMIVDAERTLSSAYRTMTTAHANAADVAFTCSFFAGQTGQHADDLAAVAHRGYPVPEGGLDGLRPPELIAPRSGPLGLLHDLGELHQLAAFVAMTWELVEQAAYGRRDQELIAVASRCGAELGPQLAWLRSALKAEAAQALLVAE